MHQTKRPSQAGVSVQPLQAPGPRTMAAALLLTVACAPSVGEDEGSEGAGTSSSASTDDPPSASSTSADSVTSILDGATESTTGAPSCDLPPVDPRIVDTLHIFSELADWLSGQVPAGGGVQLYLGYFDNTIPESVIPVSPCVEWSIEPADVGVTLDATGMLFVDASVPPGTTVTVTADVEDGRHVTMTSLTVYEQVSYDILGRWTEVQRLPCDGGPPFEPEPNIAELVFYDNREFTVSWTAFEGLINFWGTFTYDERTSAISLSVDRPRDAPADFEGEGTANVVDGQLVLEDMWLGTAPGLMTPADCGHVFEE